MWSPRFTAARADWPPLLFSASRTLHFLFLLEGFHSSSARGWILIFQGSVHVFCEERLCLPQKTLPHRSSSMAPNHNLCYHLYVLLVYFSYSPLAWAPKDVKTVSAHIGMWQEVSKSLEWNSTEAYMAFFFFFFGQNEVTFLKDCLERLMVWSTAFVKHITDTFLLLHFRFLSINFFWLKDTFLQQLY